MREEFEGLEAILQRLGQELEELGFLPRTRSTFTRTTLGPSTETSATVRSALNMKTIFEDVRGEFQASVPKLVVRAPPLPAKLDSNGTLLQSGVQQSEA